MKLNVLSVAFPFAPVRPDTAGGAEQILLSLDKTLIENGHNSIVIAAENSICHGRLYSVNVPKNALINDRHRKSIYKIYRSKIHYILQKDKIDIIHVHGFDFYDYIPASKYKTLVTLHLPIPWYKELPVSDNIFYNCVSRNQLVTSPYIHHLIGYIPNGIEIQNTPPAPKKDFALWLGRICPEKGLHTAIQAAKKANIQLIAAGETYNYPTHISYFENMIEPAIKKGLLEFKGTMGPVPKQKLLSQAKCVLITSTAPETSSLVAMEACASGTAVIALNSPALNDIIDHGTTGYIVNDISEMSRHIEHTNRIDPHTCQSLARARFDKQTMTDKYFNLYHRLKQHENKTTVKI